jgi:hypothetical protein
MTPGQVLAIYRDIHPLSLEERLSRTVGIITPAEHAPIRRKLGRDRKL